MGRHPRARPEEAPEGSARGISRHPRAESELEPARPETRPQLAKGRWDGLSPARGSERTPEVPALTMQMATSAREPGVCGTCPGGTRRRLKDLRSSSALWPKRGSLCGQRGPCWAPASKPKAPHPCPPLPTPVSYLGALMDPRRVQCWKHWACRPPKLGETDRQESQLSPPPSLGLSERVLKPGSGHYGPIPASSPLDAAWLTPGGPPPVSAFWATQGRSLCHRPQGEPPPPASPKKHKPQPQSTTTESGPKSFAIEFGPGGIR
ncbi:MAPK-interacting and spindle-stabilizing protein-like, partial [Tachyglossus aculeatus]|uniref:MAPK-interacting and spindle-stabilizing protein-like n=1 Tax=Tachyglossus aculeatus TaxID=9261 RepID=UPI0018F3BD6D